MGTELICLAVAVIGGLLMSRLTKLLNLPAKYARIIRTDGTGIKFPWITASENT